MHILGIIVIGLLVGLIARFVTPGRDPGGIIVTIAIGIAGSVLATYGEPAGFVGSVVGAVVLLVLVRLFGR